MSDSLRDLVARAMYEDEHVDPNDIPWLDLPEVTRMAFGHLVDAALAAIEASGTHIICSVEARLRSYWHEGMGPQLWWIFPIAEPPYCGSPLYNDWPDYHTHFTPIPLAARPRDAAPTDKEV